MTYTNENVDVNNGVFNNVTNHPYTMCVCPYCGKLTDFGAWNERHKNGQCGVNNEKCRGCDHWLEFNNLSIADGCPCNSPRGINHGIVPKEVCTCEVCDSESTGTSRFVVLDK